MDGIDHVVRRSIVAPEFVGKRLEAYREVIDRNARDLIEPWRRDGRVDLVDAFTTRLPINVIIDMLDLPKADHHRFHAWYSAMMAGLGRGEHRAAGQAAHAEVCAYVEPFLAERNGCPGPGPALQDRPRRGRGSAAVGGRDHELRLPHARGRW